MTSPMRRALAATLVLFVAASVAAGCGSDDSKGDGAKASEKTKLVVYSGREKKLVDPLYKEFEKTSGIDLEVRYADSPAMAAQLQEEGENSPADVFYSQDAGAIGAVEELLEPLPGDLGDEVPAEYRDDKGRWTGVTGRIRTLVYNTDELKDSDLPDTVLDVTDPKWKGKIGVAPTNASFIGFISAMRIEQGDDAARKFLKGLVDNDAKIYEKNGPIVDAVSKGEVQIGLVNHYYIYELLSNDPDAPVANHFFAAGDIGNLVNVSAIGILRTSPHQKEAKALIDFMLHDGQRFIVEEAPEREYPLVVTPEIADNARYKELPPLADAGSPDVDLSSLGAELEKTVQMISESGLAR